jgi:hypothetical protein
MAMSRPLSLLAVIAAVACSACLRDAAGTQVLHDADGTGGTTPAAGGGYGTGGNDAAPAAENAAPGSLPELRAEFVYGRTGPDGLTFEVALRTPGDGPHARRFGRRTMIVALREGGSDLSQYPCTSCHMGRGTVLRDERVPDAHAAIQPTHPRVTGATCATCHAADNVELLALNTGEQTTLDHAYRVCAQCHFPQADAWAAGAHGKRLDGWQGRRVVMGCTECHDPHAPSLERRLPFRPPRLHRPEGRTP